MPAIYKFHKKPLLLLVLLPLILSKGSLPCLYTIAGSSTSHITCNTMQEGWGKTWSYAIGFGRLGVADVSLRYSKDREATKRRLSGVVDMGFASACCSQLTQFLRRDLSSAEARIWQKRDTQERLELHGESSQPQGPLPGLSIFGTIPGCLNDRGGKKARLLKFHIRDQEISLQLSALHLLYCRSADRLRGLACCTW